MGNFLLIPGECELQLEYFNFRFLSCGFQPQADLTPASPFFGLQIWLYFKSDICEERNLRCTLRDIINSDAWSKSVYESYYLDYYRPKSQWLKSLWF